MKRKIIALLFLLMGCTFLNAAPYSEKIKELLVRLDSLIAQKNTFAMLKEAKIAQLHKLRKDVRTLEERYLLNKNLYDEYCVYNADSAMNYVAGNLDIVYKQNDKYRQMEWKIKKSFLLAATGLLKEAQDELDGVSGGSLPKELLVDYYGQMLYLYSHFNQYTGSEMGTLHEHYAQLERVYKDSLNMVLTPEDPLFLWYKGQVVQGTDSMYVFKERLQKGILNSAFDTRRDAMNAYVLACFYRESDEQENYLTYLIYSAMADVRISNKDIASLEELAGVLFSLGDIDHAYVYMSYCLQNALAYRNRVRVVGISAVQDTIHQIYQERNQRQEARLRMYLVLVSVLSLISLFAFLYIYKQMKRLKQSRQQLNEANNRLNKHVEELSKMHGQVAETNVQLTSLNEQLRDTNNQLRESNYVKEEYIGYVFSICSNYISKLDEYRKNINRKLKANQLEDVKALTDTHSMAQNELKEFYHNFDAIFLHIYPDFVSDFNALLHPDEQIVLKDGELLNTELRIYALVRLGITDSVKIAEFLHYSPQTVYNKRLKTRNKAIIPREEFAAVVRSLGRAQKWI